uniref:Uncharacterized protein n=1 Tax=Otus sunia TaxID=257818 RepID=A0A8C8BHB2_9STRI
NVSMKIVVRSLGISAWLAGGNCLLVLFVKPLSFSKIRHSANTNHYMEFSKFSEQYFQPTHPSRLNFWRCFAALATIKNRLQDFCSSCPKTYCITYFITIKFFKSNKRKDFVVSHR